VKNSLAGIMELVRRETGITVPVARETALRAALSRVAPGLDTAAFLRLSSDPKRGRDLIDRLIDEVTVQETTFVRDRRQLGTIAWPSLLQSARAAGSQNIRVWSAACASGEEPYSLAMLAAEAFAPARAPVDILGTDISGAALAAAVAGRYGTRAVRAVEEPLLGRYLEHQADGTYLIGQALRGLVRFGRHNLASDPIPPRREAGFDLIACRNVLIYFEQPLVRQVITSLERALRPGGMLILGAADALQRPAAGRAVPVTGIADWERQGKPAMRRPLGRHPARTRAQRLAAALGAADKGDRDGALVHVAALLAANPLDADAHFVQGLVMLEAGEPARAAAALRRALYTDAAFALAAFTLGRACDAMGDRAAGRRAYQRALLTLDPDDHRHELILQQVDIADIAAACRARLASQPRGNEERALDRR
jgi:chemotaxis methyl-accepting protein methylase